LARLCAKKLLPRVPRRLVTRLASGPQSSQKVRQPSTRMFRSCVSESVIVVRF
jgi:hypothetical protein